MHFVIFSAIVGSYDEIIQPSVTRDGFDFVLFSNTIKHSSLGIWQIRQIPYENPDSTRVARWVKTHPEELLPEYDASVWIDANILIRTTFLYERVINLFNKRVSLSTMCHGSRNCIYKEAAVVAYRGIEKETLVLNWLRWLTRESYPHTHGLFETNVLYRIHNQDVLRFDKFWWSCIDHYSKRDQLSFNYCLWKLHLNCLFFISPFENTRNSEHFSLRPHEKRGKEHFAKNDIVLYFRALPQHGPNELGEIYEKLVGYSGYRFLRIPVSFFYKMKSCLILKYNMRI